MGGEASRRNGKKGGRPKGSKDPHTLERELARHELQRRIIAQSGPVFDAYLERAKGVWVMVEFDADGLPQRVRDSKRVDAILADKTKRAGKDYVFVETHTPDAKILLDVVARLDGKPTERVEVTGPGGDPIQVHHHYATPAPAKKAAHAAAR